MIHLHTAQPAWHILQISGPLDTEFATAMANRAPVIGWSPQRSLTPWFFSSNAPAKQQDAGSSLAIRSFPLLRGYARPPLSIIARTGPTVARLLQSHAHTPDDVLVCTVPYFASVAERWPGPVVYWLTDLILRYPSAKGIDVKSLDERMCKAATLLCPNSSRLRDYLLRRGADPDKILIVPNATRAANVYADPPAKPAPLPQPAQHLQRPVAGVIGNLAGNMDWLLLDDATARTPGVQWLFVGPTDMEIADPNHRAARARVMGRSNALFVGRQPYGDLVHYARSFDLAVLPYLKGEPTYSGSSTRFYEHLAACRPMLATRAFEELLHKQPLLKLVDTSTDLVDHLYRLGTQNFDDGLAETRWKSSLTETWEARSSAVFDRLQQQSHKPAQLTPTKPAIRFATGALQMPG